MIGTPAPIARLRGEAGEFAAGLLALDQG